MDDNLIIRFLEKRTCKEESLHVLKWIESSEKNKKYYRRMHAIWVIIQMDLANETDSDQIDLIMKNIKKQENKNKRLIIWKWTGSIAVVLVLIFGLNFFLQIDSEPPFDYESMIRSVPKSKEITLTMNSSNKSKHEKYKTITIQDSIANLNYSDKGQITINDTIEIQADTRMNTIRVPFGKRSVLILEDSTRVYLNSGSILIYPSVFSDGERRIFLDGEAFLDVKEDTGRKFIVQTIYKSIEVLGTRFNVSVDKESAIFETVLVEGSIALEAKNKMIVLSPNEYYSFQALTEKEEIEKVDVTNYISWVEGKLKFKKEPMYNAIKKLAKVYNIKIKLKDEKYAQSLVSGELNLKDSAEESMAMLMSIVVPEHSNNQNSIFEISYNN